MYRIHILLFNRVKIVERKLKSYFPLLPESISESQKLLLYKYMVALVKYYDGKSEVVHYFDDFVSDLQIDLYAWMNKHNNKLTDCNTPNENSSKKAWDAESEIISQAAPNNIEIPESKPLNPKLFHNKSPKSTFPQPFDHHTVEHSLEQPTTDLFIALREKYKSLPDNLKLKHPMIYPELYRWDDQSEYFGTKTAKEVILDGSNVAFGHGQFQPNGKYIKADDYNFQNKTCRFSFGFIREPIVMRSGSVLRRTT